jgi:UrcA family protein
MTQTRMTAAIAVPLALAAALATALPATASETAVILDMQTGPSTTVRYWDLDLGKADDTAELYSRISRAAASVCRTLRDVRNVSTHRYYTRCLEMATDRAVRAVGNINLTVLHDGRGPALASR